MLTFSAILEGASLRKDSTIALKLGTQELPPEDSAKLFAMGNKYVHVAIDEVPVTNLDVPKEVTEFDGQKSTSERLHSVLYVYWNTKTDKTTPFETFRKNYMEKIIQNVKDKLD